MKKFLFLVALLLLCAAQAHGQNTVVTATVVDPNGVPYQAGTGHFNIQCTANAQPYYNGSPLPRSIVIPALSGTGAFTITVWDTSIPTDTNNNPLSCQWQVQILDHCQVATFSVLVTGVTGAGPVNLTSQIDAAAVPVSPQCNPNAGTGGTVTDFVSGNLPPLFTTSVSNPTTTPHLAFLLDNAGAGTIFGNPSASPAPPSFNPPSSYSGIGTVTSVAATAPIVVTPSPITGAGTVSCPHCAAPVKRIILPFASCSAGTAASAWDLPTSSAATAACKSGTNTTQQGILQYADGSIAYYPGVVPSDWTSWAASTLSFTTSDTTSGHTIIFNLLLACETPNAGNTDDPPYGAANAFSTVTIGAGAVANASYQTSTGNLTGGGCVANSILHVQLTRATDTSTDTAVAATGWLEVLYNGTLQ
jgi:hypothetical protein